MTYSSYEVLIRRAVRDHQRIGRVGGERWVVAAPAPEGALQETLRTGYAAWLRTTAVAGLASALLVPSVAVAASPASAPGTPGVPATNPQAIRPPRLAVPKPDVPNTDLRPQTLLKGLVQDEPEDTADHHRRSNAPHAAAQLDRQSGKPVSPLQKPPPARPVIPAPNPSLAAPKAQAPQIPPGPAAMGELPRAPATVPSLAPIPRPSHQEVGGAAPGNVDSERSQPPSQRPAKPSATPEEREQRAGAAELQAVTPERVDRWVTAVRTAMREAPKGKKANPALVTLAEVSPTPRMGWSYRVQPGDSLWRISTRLWTDHASDHSLDRTWRTLHEWNRDVVGPDSSRIYPGRVLEIPADAEDITTTLSVERASRAGSSSPERTLAPTPLTPDSSR